MLQRPVERLQIAVGQAREGGADLGFERNGDVVEIFTSKVEDAGPSRDWLGFVQSPRARNKIKQWFTKERRDEAIELQNAVAYGLTAGIHSLDAGEIATWLDRVQAGNLAHGLKSPLTVLNQELTEIDGERGQILRDQVALIGDQVERRFVRLGEMLGREPVIVTGMSLAVQSPRGATLVTTGSG